MGTEDISPMVLAGKWGVAERAKSRSGFRPWLYNLCLFVAILLLVSALPLAASVSPWFLLLFPAAVLLGSVRLREPNDDNIETERKQLNERDAILNAIDAWLECKGPDPSMIDYEAQATFRTVHKSERMTRLAQTD